MLSTGIQDFELDAQMSSAASGLSLPRVRNGSARTSSFHIFGLLVGVATVGIVRKLDSTAKESSEEGGCDCRNLWKCMQTSGADCAALKQELDECMARAKLVSATGKNS